MNLQEAIKHCEEKSDCTECGQKHAQLAEWLKELQAYKELGFAPEEIAYLSNFFKEQTSVDMIAENFKIVSIIGEYEKLKERDTPYRPKPDTIYYGNGICKCGALFLTKDTDFCGNCGQRIDWSEEEDHEKDNPGIPGTDKLYAG